MGFFWGGGLGFWGFFTPKKTFIVGFLGGFFGVFWGFLGFFGCFFWVGFLLPTLHDRCDAKMDGI